MARRKQLIEEIVANFHAIKNKVSAHVTQLKDVTYSQLIVLAIIGQQRDLGIKEIAKKLSISSSAATQLVIGLVKKGYVTRKENLKDRRALQLVLSQKGQKHITELKHKHLKTIAALFDALSDSELETYLALHKKILLKLS